MSRTESNVVEKIESCEYCGVRRSKPCSRADCSLRHEITAAPPPDEDVQYIGLGCSVTRRHPGAE